MLASNPMINYWKDSIFYLISSLFYIAVVGIILAGVRSFKFNRQFYEQDPDFSYHRSLSSTVSGPELYYLTILLSVFSIFTMVFCLTERKFSCDQHKTKEIINLLISFFTSFIVAGLIVTILKILVTKPRPAMFYLCNYQGFRDAVDSGNFTSYYALTNSKNLGNTDNCWDQGAYPDCIYSFPSGHSATAFVAFFWDVEFFLYFTKKLPFMKNLKWILWFPMILATWIAYSRIYDYKHREIDVVTGGLIGIACAHYFFQEFIQYFEEHEMDKNKKEGEVEHGGQVLLVATKETREAEIP